MKHFTPTLTRPFCLAMILAFTAAGMVFASGPGQEDFDKAAQRKLSVKTLEDQNEVIRLCESAIAKGLDEESAAFARSILVSTLFQRAEFISKHLTSNSATAEVIQRRHQFAVADLEKAVKLDPKQPQALVLLAKLKLMTGKAGRKDAKAALDQAIDQEDDNPDNLAEALVMRAELQEKPELGIADAERALAIQPDWPRAMRIRAMQLVANNQLDDAVKSLQGFTWQEPKNIPGLLQLAMLQQLQGRSAQAVETFSTILAVEPKNWQALRARGDAYLNIGRQREAIADYEKALKIDRKDEGLLNNFAWVLATSPDPSLRDGQRAVALATEACVMTDYKAAYILSTLAAACAETGDFDGAVKWSAKAIELGDKQLGDGFVEELTSYKAGRPWRESLSEKTAKE